jgi:uncharacterized protein (TIGR03437 family)
MPNINDSRFHAACLAVMLAAIAPRPAAAQTYKFTKILDASTQRGDGLGTFWITYSRTTPGFDGKWVVFRDPGPRNDDGSHAAIWTYNTQDGTFHKIVDFQTTVPGSGAAIHDLQLSDSAPWVRNGTVVFLARDTTNRQGLYAVPASGGPLVKIADSATADPSGGVFTVFDAAGKQMGGFAFDGSTVVFHASGSTLTAGNYSANADGSSLAVLADSNHPAQNGAVAAFSAPAVSGGKAVVIGTDSTPNAAGYNAIYAANVGAGGALTELINSGAQLPDDPNPAFHTRFDSPVLAFDNGLAAFHATDSKSANFSGLYTTDLVSHAVTKVADLNSTLPGLGQLKAIAISGVAVNRNAVLFQATDISNASALYVWRNGTAVRVVGTGDLLDGRTVFAVADPGPSALYGSGFAFVVDFGNDRALYVAAEAFSSVSAAGFIPGAPLAPGSIAAGFGQGLASATGQAATLPLPISLADTTVTLRDSAGADWQAPLFYVGPGQINYLVPENAAPGPATVTVTSAGRVTAQGFLTIDAVAPALFTANSDGRGVPSGQSITVAPDQTQTYGALATCSGGAGSCVPVPLDLGPAGARLILVLYGTGIRGRSSLANVTATAGSLPAAVLYAGVQPTFAGLDQLNIELPTALAGRGDVDVLVTVDGKSANPVRVNIR